jgi:23S rRNA pseudouridine1911/1915/1917 synthase
VWAANPSGKPSKSLAKAISRTTSTTTFEVSLNSGRPHQIRIHLASIGHPLVGDPLYGLTGQPLENLPGLPGDGGYFLHAQFLKFHHPITGEQINLEAALPSDSHCISRFTAGIKSGWPLKPARSRHSES